MLVTDMILDADQWAIPEELPEVTLRAQTPETRAEILAFVAAEHPSFSQYYKAPKEGTDVYAVTKQGQLVGAVLIEKQPGAAESSADGALACLVTAKHLRGQRLGSAAIVESALALRELGFRRVIAEYVASIELYSRLGFRVWRTRDVASE